VAVGDRQVLAPRSVWRRLRDRYAHTGTRGRELLAIGCILLVTLPATAVVMSVRGEGNFYQQYFGAAVMLSCGEGFGQLRTPSDSPELERFLHREVRSVDCSAVRGLPVGEATDFQKSARWLMTSTAALWWLTGGPSWDSMLPLHLLLVAISALAAYGLLRLVARRAVAAPLAIGATLWPYHLFMVAHLRDYSKAPFIWLGCYGLALGVLGSSLRTRFGGAVLGGLAVGVGLGFRADLLFLALLGAAALALFQPWEGPGRIWTRPAVAAVFVACFAFAAAPILPSYGDSSNNGGIIALEGLSPLSSDAIGLKSELYRTSYIYEDMYTAGLASAHGRLVDHEPGPYEWGSTEFDDTANDAYFDQAKYLPADTVLRAGFSGLASLRLGTVQPFTNLVLGLPIAFAALALLGARRPRALVFALFLGLPLACVTTVQWDERHAFHIALVSFLVIAAGVELGLRMVANRRGDAPSPLPTRRAAMASAGALVALIIAAVGVWGVAVVVQDERVADYLTTLESEPRTPVPAFARRAGTTTVLPLARDYVETWDGVPDNRSSLLRVAVSECSASSAALTLRYDAADPYYDYTTRVQVQPSGGALWYVVAPQISGAWPSALELAGAPGCTLRADRVTPRELPILLNVVVDDETRDGPLHATPDLKHLVMGSGYVSDRPATQ
jgi:hypothetical protein